MGAGLLEKTRQAVASRAFAAGVTDAAADAYAAELAATLDNAGGLPMTRRQAQTMARRVARAARLTTTRGELVDLCERWRVEYPESDHGAECERARCEAPEWWGRQLRVSQWREFERAQLAAGNVRHYVSEPIARARQWHRAELADLLRHTWGQSEEGGPLLTLADVAASGVSNPALRRLELGVRADGLQAEARRRGWQAVFWTATAPGVFHRTKTVGAKGKGDRLRLINEKWNGADPRQVQAYMCDCWARVRAELARQGVEYYGLRIVEPHTDGCPHWHGMAWAAPDALATFERVVSRHFCAMNPDEITRAMRGGAKNPRVNFKRDDGRAGGSFVGYLLKYISKNIDGRTANGTIGQALDRDGYKIGEAVESAARAEAWASVWGIRQFQEFGSGAKVTAYRELRRVREAAAVPEPMQAAHAAADAGDYGAFIRDGRQLSLWTEETPAALNRWGEPVGKVLRGVQVAAAAWLATRGARWLFVVARDAAEAAEKLAEAFATCGPGALACARWKLREKWRESFAFAGRESGPPWGGGNNCTGWEAVNMATGEVLDYAR